MMLGYNYTNALNGAGAFAGTVPGSGTTVQAPLTLASRYGKPIIFQNARQLRLAVRFTF
jgi:hypothetical protein